MIQHQREKLATSRSSALLRLLRRIGSKAKRSIFHIGCKTRVSFAALFRTNRRVDGDALTSATKTDATFILGMHRSGTSCLTGCLERCGLDLADVSRTAREWNRKGTLENLKVHEINDDMVGSWLKPRFDKRTARTLRPAMRNCVREFQHLRHVGLKDPRFLFTLDAWLPLFSNPQFIGIFRSPSAVHQSLMKRNEGRVSLRRNLTAWKRYNRKLLELHDEHEFPILCFDWSRDIFLRELESACKILGLTFDKEAVSPFYEEGLRHHQQVGFLEDAEAEAIYNELARKAAPIRKVFLGGSPSSGTTVLMKALQQLDFAQGPEGEGNFHPGAPNVLMFERGNPQHNYQTVAEFTSEEAGDVDRWVRSFCTQGNCFFEKSPFHMSKFGAFEDLYGAEAFFIVIQRDPEQTIASCMQRWGSVHADYSRPIDLMLQSAIDFDRQVKNRLSNFIYVRYEDLCAQPVSVLKRLCNFLQLTICVEQLQRVCASLDISIKNRHENIERLGYTQTVYDKCQELGHLWGYRTSPGIVPHLEQSRGMRRKIKVLHVFNSPLNCAGMETFALNYFRNIDGDRISFEFLFFGKITAEHYADEIDRLGGNIIIGSGFLSAGSNVLFSQFGLFRKYLEVRRIIRDGSFDVVHINTRQTRFFAMMSAAAKAEGVPRIICHTHSGDIRRRNWMKLRSLKRRFELMVVRKNATMLVACSEFAAQVTFGNALWNRKNGTVVKNAIELGKFAFDEAVRTRVRSEFGLKGKFIVGHIGRFSIEKNHEFLFKVFAEIYQREPDAVLLLYGDGELKGYLQEKAKEAGIEKVVRFMGISDRINECMQAMDVFVFPSLFEGLGIALIEAQASGLRCLASAKVIPNETDVTNTIEYIPLESSPVRWAEAALKYRNGYARETINTQDEMVDYDIRNAVPILEDLYLRECESS